MAQFVVSSYQLQKWALAIKLAQARSTDEHDTAHINRSMREIGETLRTQNEELHFDAGYEPVTSSK